MTSEPKQAGYEGRYIQGFQYYLQNSEEHKHICQFVDKVLTGEFPRIAEGKTSVEVLGVGSGGGELDAHMLSVLQTKLPGTPITADIVEPSSKLIEQFKALVAKTANLQKIPFAWHGVSCGEYEKQVKDKGQIKKFDFIHMIQMLFYVDDYAATIKFFHSLLNENGKLLIIHEAANSGWDKLWKTFKRELCTKTISEYLSSGEIKGHLEKLGLKYEEHMIPNTFDVTNCFTQGSKQGELLLDFMTDTDNFQQNFSEEVKAGMLDLIKNKCSIQKDGRVLFDCTLSCLLVFA
ncbi:histamine N-methyltransferase-like [Hypomesus transpacificus]|uniref:histamine N-methyltransferase-like n=1 Tax=Hypomesus transpacificus TaxID=137520 RepID=UPI001F077E2E|nr:histamine N-methyltransferase-like [Hypomesus transpacificus]